MINDIYQKGTKQHLKPLNKQALHVRLLIKNFRYTRSNILDLVPLNEILCCLVNGEFLESKLLALFMLCENFSSQTLQLCDLSVIQSNNFGRYIALVQKNDK